ncbi:MAG: NAD-dependent dihydropyrimidine dehydrogenase subunit PreA [Clostridia bacterium]|nr:NAD-dependent dihydropyrimidine dehydrogenase subunit PreA [Clostridia bacterium]
MSKRKMNTVAMASCLLCDDAKCKEACPHFDPSKALRSLWFDNEGGARAVIPDTMPCADCSAPCVDACVQSGKIDIRGLMLQMGKEIPACRGLDPARLKIDFLGFPLENPFLLSSSVVGSNYDMCRRAFQMGWAGVAYKTICLFDIHETSPRYAAIKDPSGTVIGFKNVEQLSDLPLEENLLTFRRLKAEFPEKYLLVSIMGRDEEEWETLARLAEENGADAVELNFSCPNMKDDGLGSDVGQDNLLIRQFTAAARRGTKKPIIAKLTPNVQEMSSAALAAKEGGADGLAAINTLKSYITLDSETYAKDNEHAAYHMTAIGGYSGASVKPIALRFIAELKQNPMLCDLPVSGMGGVETWRDAAQFMIMGASSVQVTTAVMLYGYRIIEDLCDGLLRLLDEYKLENVEELVAIGLKNVVPLHDVERDKVIYPRFDLSRCVGCRRCLRSCMDGGHQAIFFEKGHPRLDAARCVGCHLCVIVCPKEAVSSSGISVPRHRQP